MQFELESSQNSFKSIPHKIKLLPEHIVDQIKAGEVVERACFVIKELVENSIDAKASEINIFIVENGLKLIRVQDNGEGINFNDLPYAFLRHATSKIDHFEDLFSLNSYGFRGEALASIASISRVSCNSIPSVKSQIGGKLIINGGKIEQHTKMSNENLEIGTNIVVQDLFYNTPVRLKFLKSKNSEKNQIKKILEYFLLTSPQITFTIKWDNLEKEVYPKTENTQLRIQQILNMSKEKNKKEAIVLNEQSLTYENYKINAYLTTSSKLQYLFINGRLILDKQLLQYVNFCFKKNNPLFLEGSYFIFIEVPKDEIDINIHPNKTVVKFSNQNLVFSLISAVLKKFNDKKELITANNSLNLIKELSIPSENNVSNKFESKLKTIQLNEYFLINTKNDNCPLLLINFNLYLNDLFTNKIFFNSIKNEEDLIPLLVAEPLNIIKKYLDSNFKFFKNYGFEFERVDGSLVILKTVPALLGSDAHILQLLNHFFNFLNENLENSEKINSIIENFFSEFIVTQSLFSEFYSQILESIDKNSINSKSIKIITPKILSDLIAH